MTERRDDAEERKGPVIRDKRRIDPETGEVREPADTPAPESPTAKAPSGADADKAAKLEKELAERTADLQRLQAEYSNYRKRVDRDRTAVREQALAYVLGELLPVLDDIGRAREHDELTGGFKHVAEALEGIVGKLGLESFGTAGEPFDPNVHEALMHSYSDEVAEPTAVQILQAGYRIGERTLRPARVAVAEPTADLGSAEEAASESEPEPASTADGAKAEAEPDGAGED
ncbi:nucleotide exchange factor GrpE [Actinoallomurus soli]|uniref:nucleotide exchange factor GrpE n=1 Tax=Actinoallomurus soli TaxID=2952535 RepID=UPI0020938BED|nr:nucleotide exchange factor GrpE [Actinoallomurus soli]MCO5970432.1 nucleotide exchange factor GrpE [Actinoallomurus soli]